MYFQFGTAHCISEHSQLQRLDRISVHVGREDLNLNTTYLQVLNVSQLIIYPEHDGRSLKKDIGIIMLSTYITMSDYVQPACIWNLDDDFEFRFNGSTGIVIGFGLTEAGKVSEHLQQAELIAVDGITCLMSNPHALATVLNHHTYCAKGKQGAKADRGDSGGGMFYELNGTWYVRGVVSFTTIERYYETGAYTVFSDVRMFRGWILRYSSRAEWLKNLKPCNGSLNDNESVCNVANRFEHGFLITGDRNDIISIPTNGGKGEIIIPGSNDSLTGRSYDCTEGRIYFIDDGHIFSVNYDGSHRKSFFNDTKYDRARRKIYSSLTIDWVSRRLYTQLGGEGIWVVSMDNTQIRTILHKGNRICCPIVDPMKSKLYWLRYSKAGSYIK
ncbi:AGAP013252-PA-like protein [Anopheles sinensis]|uniref:AGAP013252-PA-like protein n=1 Tax=Anopheles sinensis TaxID=74873 RepID=A0A084W4J9_ANOSI|nr:AGAP013252-PA-like protein [Anopheles sinensis]